MKNKYSKANKHLSRVELRFKKVIKKYAKVLAGASKSEINNYQLFLIRSIIYQQISGKAAESISRKFAKLFKDEKIKLSKILKLTDGEFQSAGVSPQKRKYIRDLARHAENRLLPLEKDLVKLSDEQIIETLTLVKGIGVWTAQMLLIFYLERPDVFPSLDLGIKKGFQKLYKMKTLPAESTILSRSKKWQPHRTTASLYLWLIQDSKD